MDSIHTARTGPLSGLDQPADTLVSRRVSC